MPGRLADLSLMFSFFFFFQTAPLLFVSLHSPRFQRADCVCVCLGEVMGVESSRVLLKIAEQHSKRQHVLAKKGFVKEKSHYAAVGRISS